METDTNEFIDKLEKYLVLEKNIKEIKNPEILKENQDYRALLNLETELKKYTLNSNDIIEIYKSLKDVYDREKNIFDVRYDSMEKEYKSEINDLEETVSNLKNSKDNLRKLIKDPTNFFNGEIVNEIKKEY